MLYALLAPLAGVFFTFCFAPWPLGALAVVPLAVLFALWQHPTRQHPLRDAGLFALAHLGSGLYWVYISLYHFGGAPLPFAILANVLLVLYLALYPLLAAWLMRRLSAPGSWRRSLLIPLLWTGGELVRAYLFTGFPWLAAGYSALHTPLDGLAPIGGVFLVSFALTLVASLLARAAAQPWHDYLQTMNTANYYALIGGISIATSVALTLAVPALNRLLKGID